MSLCGGEHRPPGGPDAAVRCGAFSRSSVQIDPSLERDTMQRGTYLKLAALTGALALAAGMSSSAFADELPVSTALPDGWSEVNLSGGSGNLSVTGTGPAAVFTMNVDRKSVV